MEVEIKDVPEMRVAAVRHFGPYHEIGRAFGELGQIAGAAGLLGEGHGQMIALFYDDPESTPADELRSDACITVAGGVELPSSLDERFVREGRYATTLHVGPYEGLPAVWPRLTEWIEASTEAFGPGPSLEIYLNNPMTTPKEQLETELCIPIKD